MTDLNALRARISVLDVLEKANAVFTADGAFDEEVPFFCPFCDDVGSTKPAGRANPLKGLWHCWACNRGGDVITAVMEWKGGSFTDALTWLLVEFPSEEVLNDPWADE